MAAPQFDPEVVSQILKISNQQRKEDVVLAEPEPGLFVMLLNKKANNFNFDFIRKIQDKLDVVEKFDGPSALITVGLSEKFFSSGLDLNFMMQAASPDRYNMVLEFMRLFGRLLAFPIPTIALINGYAIAGGCMLAFGHDWRIMRNDFGYFCLNEVELGMPLPPGMMSVVKYQVPNPNTFRDMVLTAKQFDAKTALKEGFVEFLSEPDQILEETLQFARGKMPLGKNQQNFKKLKEELHKTAINDAFNRQHAVGVRGEVAQL